MRTLVDILVDNIGMSIGQPRSERRYPTVLVAHGDQDLYSQAAHRLREEGFLICDVSAGEYRRAITDLNVSWPASPKHSPEETYGFQVKKEEAKLAILSGPTSHPRFWRNLRDFGALYLGSEFPPIPQISEMCRIVPDAIEVVILVKDEDLKYYKPTDLENLHFFDAIGTDDQI
jgi:hypothetical protein